MRLKVLKSFDSAAFGFRRRGEEFDADQMHGQQLVDLRICEAIGEMSGLTHKAVQVSKPIVFGATEAPFDAAAAGAAMAGPCEPVPSAEIEEPVEEPSVTPSRIGRRRR
jgi:hypothetical protein